uniref:Large ribosomal subunit protein uL22c n=1 Tax=Androsace occidentalis TaxID=522403 RepID=A0A0K1ZC60_9ERIC|nr:ribosomal protein L22 [Androsace occidentalis]
MRKEKKTEIYALGQHIPMSAHKARRVIDQIRGRSYDTTLLILELMPYRACYSIFKLVYSAAANASYNMGWNETNLIISKAEVNEGTSVKKLKPRARGRSFPIKRPTCHITIGVTDISLYLDEDEDEEEYEGKCLNMDYLTSLKKPRWTNTYTDMIKGSMYNSGGLWDKK